MFSSSCVEVLFLILNKLSVCTLVYAMVYTMHFLYCSQLKIAYCQFGRRFINFGSCQALVPALLCEFRILRRLRFPFRVEAYTILYFKSGRREPI